MCGIAGVAVVGDDKTLDPEPVSRMLRRIRHRGPEDAALMPLGGVVLGHCRLAVIDVEHGQQPMWSPSQGVVLACNGEVYNFAALRHELEAHGHCFRTQSDSEVVACAYEQWGLEFLERLDGMFALALWDVRRQRLVLARDRMGEKPLYYAQRGGVLVFGSELTAILEHPSVECRIDPAGLSAYLATEYVPAPGTIIQGVRKLEPGTFLVLERGATRIERYWHIPSAPSSALSYRTAIERLRDLLEESVRSRLVSDVPVGVFLSGGVDSSSVAALASQVTDVKTFAIGFQERSFDERRYARLVADHLSIPHYEHVLTGAEVTADVAIVGDLLDEPLADSSFLATRALAMLARSQVKVALGGDGGDELFGGYYMHLAHRMDGIIAHLPIPLLRTARAAASALPVSHENFSLGFRAARYLRGAELPPPENHAYWMAPFIPAEQRELLQPDLARAIGGAEDALRSFHDSWNESRGLAPIARATYLDVRTYLANDVLAKVDRASMTAGLEARAPLLARNVVEFAFSLPDAYRMRGLRGKRILRDAVRDLVPSEVLRRRKKGFGIPVAAWLNGPLRGLVDDMFAPDRLRAAGLFRPSVVQRLLREHRARRADHGKALWTLLVFELWREAKLGAGAPLELVGPAAS